MERTATRTVQHTTRSTLLCCGLNKKAGGARNTITGRVASVWTRRRRIAEDALRVSFVWVSPAARTTYMEGERERAHERCANVLAQCARAGRRPARRHEGTNHERALVAHHSSHTECARACRQTGSSHMGCARACTQTAGTTTRGVIRAHKRGNILRRATETVSHTFRVMSSSTRKLSTHDCTSSAVTNPAARILASSCSTASWSERLRNSASANKSDQSAA